MKAGASMMNVAWLRVSAVARFLHFEAAEIRRMIRQDKLPATQLPTGTRKVHRVCPRALHGWLRERSTGDFPSFEVWMLDVDAARVAAKADDGKGEGGEG